MISIYLGAVRLSLLIKRPQRRNPPYSSGVIIFTLSIARPAREAVYQCGQLQQICEAQKCVPSANDEVRVFVRKIRPMWGNRPNGAIGGLQQKTFAVSIASTPDTWHSLRKQRVKRMCYPN